MSWSTRSYFLSILCLIVEFYINLSSTNILFADGSIYAFYNAFHQGFHFELHRYSQLVIQLLPVIGLKIFGFQNIEFLNGLYVISIFVWKLLITSWIFFLSRKEKDPVLMILFASSLVISNFNSIYMFGLAIETVLYSWLLFSSLLSSSLKPELKNAAIFSSSFLLAFGYEFNFIVLIFALAIEQFRLEGYKKHRFYLFLLCGLISAIRFLNISRLDIVKTIEIIGEKEPNVAIVIGMICSVSFLMIGIVTKFKKEFLFLSIFSLSYLLFEFLTANVMDFSNQLYTPWAVLNFRLDFLILAMLSIFFFLYLKFYKKDSVSAHQYLFYGQIPIFICFVILSLGPSQRMQQGRKFLVKLLSEPKSCVVLSQTNLRALTRDGIGNWTLPYVAILMQGPSPEKMINHLTEQFNQFKTDSNCSQFANGYLQISNTARIFLKNSKGIKFNTLMTNLGKENSL